MGGGWLVGWMWKRPTRHMHMIFFFFFPLKERKVSCRRIHNNNDEPRNAVWKIVGAWCTCSIATFLRTYLTLRWKTEREKRDLFPKDPSNQERRTCQGTRTLIFWVSLWYLCTYLVPTYRTRDCVGKMYVLVLSSRLYDRRRGVFDSDSATESV